MNKLKKMILSIALVGGFIVGIGAMNNADAQDWRWRQRHRVERRVQVDRNGNIDRNRNGIDDRYEARGRVDLNRNGIPDQNERYWRNRNNHRAGWYDRFGRFHRY